MTRACVLRGASSTAMPNSWTYADSPYSRTFEWMVSRTTEDAHSGHTPRPLQMLSRRSRGRFVANSRTEFVLSEGTCFRII